MIRAEVTSEPLDVGSIVAGISDPRSGALSLFTGMVRDHDPSVTGEVSGLEYSAHPDAAAVLTRLAEDSHRRHGSHATRAYHRIGRLGVGEVALVVAVANAHRHEAQQACAELVESIKAELPVWKKELLASGEHVWVAW